MATILINLSKYILIFLMLFYTLFGFLMMRVKDADKLKKRAVVQNVITVSYTNLTLPKNCLV